MSICIGFTQCNKFRPSFSSDESLFTTSSDFRENIEISVETAIVSWNDFIWSQSYSKRSVTNFFKFKNLNFLALCIWYVCIFRMEREKRVYASICTWACISVSTFSVILALIWKCWLSFFAYYFLMRFVLLPNGLFPKMYERS